MELSGLPEAVVDWSRTPATRTAGATSRAHKTNDVQLRVVDYDPGYLADHWCSKGHILYGLPAHADRELVGLLTVAVLDRETSVDYADDGSPHRVRSIGGARVFIVHERRGPTPPPQTLPLNPQTSPAQNSALQPETAKRVQDTKK